VIVTQPESQTVNVGSNATLSITVLGQTPLSYQWQCRTSGGAAWSDLSDNASYAGPQSASLGVVMVNSNVTGFEFRCVVNNSLGSVTSSPPAVLTVNFPLAITTLAGRAGSYGTNNGTGSAARFYYPDGVAVDSAGNVYVAEYWNCTIRKVTPAGVVTTLAGLARSRGTNDGTGSGARFSSPSGVAMDSTGNLFVADTENYTIRRVTAAGAVTTLAGLARSQGSADGTWSAARFYYPYGVAVDSAGNVYVADSYSHTIRKMTLTGEVTTPAGLASSSGTNNGTGSDARFCSPYGVAVDSVGNVYVADMDNHTIRRGFAANAAPVIVSSWPSFGFNAGHFGFNLAGPAGRVAVIDASTNMNTWLPLWTNTMGGGAFYFSDPQSSTYPNRFYRAHTP
jgi:sugar lactone lactonase YvrE